MAHETAMIAVAAMADVADVDYVAPRVTSMAVRAIDIQALGVALGVAASIAHVVTLVVHDCVWLSHRATRRPAAPLRYLNQQAAAGDGGKQSVSQQARTAPYSCHDM